jgi:D-sedoheptulose 7-phosphate isomerase
MDFPEQYRAELLKAIDTIDLAKVRAAIQIFAEARDTGHSIFVCGNGGSASSASHFVTDMVKGDSYNLEKVSGSCRWWIPSPRSQRHAIAR